MKKIAICSLLACMCVSGVDAATYNCEVQEISSLSWKVSNEFLFPTYGDYNDANGRAYVCGHRGTNGCDSGAMVLIAGEHYFTNARQEDELYRCSTNGANAWAKSNKDVLPKCTSDQIKNFTLFGEIAVGKRRIYCKNAVGTYSAGGRCVGRNAGDICWTDYCEDCNEQRDEPRRDVNDVCYELDGVTTVAKGQKSNFETCKGGLSEDGAEHCECTCVDANSWRCDVKSCKGDSNSKPYQWIEKEINKTGGKGICKKSAGNNGGKTCEQLYPNGSPERLACCRAGKATEWIGTATSGTCKCVDTTKQWSYTAGARTGQCVDKNGPVTPVVPDEESDCYYTFNVDINCSNGTKYVAGERVKLTKEQVAQLGGCGATSAQIQSMEGIIANIQREYTAAANLMLLICGNSSATIQPSGPSDGELSDAIRTLESFASNASSQASVWKDADGKFNTARLASDLTAGVVLGTVGGVVSGVVIKKKQVEKGFDALHCTVGGHKIADWGDTFNVGLQK